MVVLGDVDAVMAGAGDDDGRPGAGMLDRGRADDEVLAAADQGLAVEQVSSRPSRWMPSASV